MTTQPVSEVSVGMMDTANSRFRIALMFTMMGLTVLGSIWAVAAGKRDKAAHVNSLAQRNKERRAKAQQNI